MTNPNDTQVGGAHYKAQSIQPWDYITQNGIGYLEGNVIKYVSRWKDKGGVQDLEKARHYLDKLISIHTTPAESQSVAASPDEGWIVNDGNKPELGSNMILEFRGGARGMINSQSDIDWALMGDDNDIVRYKRIK